MLTKKILFLPSALTALPAIINCRAVAAQPAVIKLNPQETAHHHGFRKRQKQDEAVFPFGFLQ